MSSCSPLDWLVIFAKFAQEKSFFRITKTAKVAHGSAQVYHSRKRAPFSDSCVSSGPLSGNAVYAQHMRPCRTDCCVRSWRLLLLSAIVAAFKVFRSDDFRWIYTRDVPYYKV